MNHSGQPKFTGSIEKMTQGPLFFGMALAAAVAGLPSPALALHVDHLRIEHTARPIGLDVARPRLSWILAAPAGARGQRQTAYQIHVAESVDALQAGRGDLWDSGRVESGETFGVVYAGPTLASGRRYHWRVRVWDAAGEASAWSEPEWWQMALLSSKEWQAKWIGADETETSPLLRREFESPAPVVQATVHVYAIGWYELRLNGAKVGEQVLAPLNSNYRKALFYDTYDITGQVQTGRNAVGLWLGQGYNKDYSKYGYRWTQPVAGLVQIELHFADGSAQTIISDEEWRSAPSPILANQIYHGETYDARREQPGWDEPGFDDLTWHSVVRREVQAGPLRANPMPPIKVAATISPVRVTEPQPGVTVLDFGQNIAGWMRLRLRGDSGAEVVMRHAETLDPDGMPDTRTNRDARATDRYTLRGGGEEVYEPRFTYHGFRYVEITGLGAAARLMAAEARAVHAAVEQTGAFGASSPLVNRIQENFRWSLLNNLMGIPTDTAVRDERTPCLMDSLAVEETAMHNFDLHTTYGKWLEDIKGDLGMPPNWTGDQVILPWLLFRHYGDRRLLEDHFDNMKRVTDHFAGEAEQKNYWADGFGDWAAPNHRGDYETSFSEGEVVNTAFFHRCAEVTAEAAAVLGAVEDARRYRALAAEIRQRFHDRHHDPRGPTYGSGRQVTSVLPLAFGMVPPADRQAVARALEARVGGQDRGHLDTGIFGTRYLFEVLIDHGFADTAYGALTRTSYPSFGHQIVMGATTAWEQWSYAGGMQSHNHAMFAGPGVTFYTHLAGIRATAPGFREIEIRPTRPAGLMHASGEIRTMLGTVASAWDATRGYVHRVTIPVNATAIVHVPAAGPQEVWEGGVPVGQAAGVTYLGQAGTEARFQVGSGEYVFSRQP